MAMSKDRDFENGIHSEVQINRLQAENRERLKELSAINQTTKIIKEGKSAEETLQQICYILPNAWQYPEFTHARIRFDGMEFCSPAFQSSAWKLSQKFKTINEKSGQIEVFYSKEFPEMDQGPFLKEELHLIENLAHIINGYLNSLAAKELIGSKKPEDLEIKKPLSQESIMSRQLLQKFLTRKNYERDIYHDLMPFKVREILLVANLYDAYSIEEDGRFSDHILGEYNQLNLTSMPRITGVSSYQEIFVQLNSKHFDLVIIMMGVDKNTPISLSKKIKEDFPYIPVFLLLNNNGEMALFQEETQELRFIDRIFIYNGESKVFFAMVKHLEDKVNAENDTRIGLVNVILLVEDSAKYYSRYLPLLYNSVLEQTKRIIEDVNTDELYKILRLRARPKILLVSNYDDAIEVFNKYKAFMLCLITDVKYKRNGKMDPEAGFNLVKHIRKEIKDLPTIIQSSEESNSKMAYKLKSTFINKNSDTLNQEIKSFISHYLGFGNFVYKNAEGKTLAVAKSLKEFEENLKTIPDDSILYHAKRNHFSLWLMARGEIEIARIINPRNVNDFVSAEEIRKYLLDVIQKHRQIKNRGKVIPFEESAVLDESNIVSLMAGSLGGKGRGLAFINTLIYNFDFQELIPGINIKSPKTMIIGTEEFEYFIERNKLRDLIMNEWDYPLIREKFLEGSLSENLMKKLRVVQKLMDKPLAIRSSGLFEDSMMQPFAGIFETYLLPNNNPDHKIRLNQTMDAIKMVFASVFSNTARGYFESVNYKIEEEKMAVVIQEVVGNEYDGAYYPHISGVAQSYNFYPFAHMKPEDGFAVVAVGLGRYVVEGEKAFRFSPPYPDLEINSPKDQFKNSQMHFYAVDLNKKNLCILDGEDAGLIKLDIDIAEKHGNLKHCASVYDPENDRIVPGLDTYGPRIVNFANVLKYNYIPMADTIKTVLDVVKEALGSPVEIEFAIDLNKDKNSRASFYLLQIKPLIGSAMDYNIDMSQIDQDSIILYSERCMGNGKISNIRDLVYMEPERFDKGKTEQMAKEIDEINRKMMKENKKYVLIGPGRWGTRDKWIGIPVAWPQISNAKVIVETDLEDFPLDGSSGSHFFHNVTSMNVGYFTVLHGLGNNRIEYDVFRKQKVVQQGAFFTHVLFEKSLTIRMDGKKRISIITCEKD
jgi:hypothetical protein